MLTETVVVNRVDGVVVEGVEGVERVDVEGVEGVEGVDAVVVVAVPGVVPVVAVTVPGVVPVVDVPGVVRAAVVVVVTVCSSQLNSPTLHLSVGHLSMS